MPHPQERKRVVNTLRLACTELGLKESKLLDDLRFKSQGQNRIESLIRKKINSIANLLDWGSAAWPEVPDSLCIDLIVDALDSSLLEASIIRSTLVDWLVKTSTESSLMRLRKVLKVRNNEELSKAAGETEFRLSSSFAVLLCSLTGLPISYSVRGNYDVRPPSGVFHPIRYPPPLAEFQVVVRDSLLICLRESGGRGCVVMPTGSGKTRTTVDAVLHWAEEELNHVYSILWVADRDELCDQAVDTFENLAGAIISQDIDYCRYWHGNHADVQESKRGLTVPGITVTSVQQFRRRLENREPAAEAMLRNSDVIIVDEAHRNLDWLESLVRDLETHNPETRLIGLTATPFRSKTSETARFAKLFRFNAFVPIEGGELDPEMVADKLTDMGILAKRIDTKPADLVGNCKPAKMEIEIIKSLANSGSKSIIVFTNSVDESKTLSSLLRLDPSCDISAEQIDSSTPLATRRSIINAFKEGSIQVLFNYGILTTGFDSPGIDTVVLFRRAIDETSSLYAQMVGRGLRGPLFGGTETCQVVHYRGV